MFLAIAAQTLKTQNDYKIWYLELDALKNVIGIGVKTKNELIESVFENFTLTRQTGWRCFKKNAETSTPVEIFDFASMNAFENTHFGNLPTLEEFQQTLNSLSLQLEIQDIAS